MADASVVVREGNSLTILSRIAGVNGADIDQNALGSIHLTLTRQSDGADTIDNAALVIADQVYNTLQTFTYPSGRTFRYNFKHIINGTYLTVGGEKYTALYTFVDVDNYQYVFDVDIDIRNIT